MNKLRKAQEYKILSALPAEIKSLEHTLRSTRADYEKALDDQQEAKDKLDASFKSGTSAEIAEAKKTVRDATDTVEALQEQIQRANTDLEAKRKQFDEVSATFRDMLIKESEKVLKDFKKHVQKVDELNTQLKELNSLGSVGKPGNKRRLAPNIPTLSISNQSKPLKKRLDRWHSTIEA